MPCQGLRAAGGELLRVIAQILPHMHDNRAQAARRQTLAEFSHAVLAARQDKYPGVCAYIGAEIAASAVGTDANHILIGCPQLGAQVRKAADPR